MESVKDTLDVKPFKPVKVSKFISSEQSDFYRYNGSLTTPGCDEIVIWTLLKVNINNTLVSFAKPQV